MGIWIRAGMVANFPLALSAAAYGSVLGVLAAQKGISWFELLLMNLFIFAGSSQFVMIEMWMPPLPVLEITLAVMMINLRYFLASVSLQPVFRESSLFCKFSAIHLLVDENWAVTLAAHRNGGTTPAFLIGGGICLLCAWSSGTLLGHQLGNLLSHPEKYALDFAFTAVFTALLFSFWRGKQDLLPWLVTALLALVSEYLFAGKWYIVIGGIGGALLAALRSPSTQINEK